MIFNQMIHSIYSLKDAWYERRHHIKLKCHRLEKLINKKQLLINNGAPGRSTTTKLSEKYVRMDFAWMSVNMFVVLML